jgi:hypothetical protein
VIVQNNPLTCPNFVPSRDSAEKLIVENKVFTVLSHFVPLFFKDHRLVLCPIVVPALSQACPTSCWDREAIDSTGITGFSLAIYRIFLKTIFQRARPEF